MNRHMTEFVTLRITKKSLFLQGLIGGITTGFCLSLIMAALEYGGLYITEFSILIVAGFFWFCVAIFVLFLLLAFLKRFRPAAIRLLSAEFGMVACMAVAVMPIVNFAHFMVLDHELDHARPVIAALMSFQEEHKRPAYGLDQLTQTYFETLPTPARDVCNYSYKVSAVSGDHKRQETPNPSLDKKIWEFSIGCPADWLFDVEVLVYRPDGQYETVESAWKQHPMGDWMYYYFRD